MAFSDVLYHGVESESENDADTEIDNLSARELFKCHANEEDKMKLEGTGKDSSSLCHATWNLFNMVQGTGILGLPYAVKEGGLVVIFGLALLAIISNYTGQILICCLYEKDTQDSKKNESTTEKPSKIRVRGTYEDIGRECFPRFGGKIVVMVQIVELLFVSTLYLVLSGSLMVHTFPYVSVSERGWIALGALAVLPTVFLEQLSHVAWFSLFSIVALLTTVAAVTGFGIQVSERWDIDSIDICNIETLPVGIGIVLFSFAAHPLLPGIEESMKNKSKFPLIMNISFSLAALTKILFSLTAYLSFSEKTQEVITNNLPAGVVRTVGCVLLVINVLFSYAFPMFTVIRCITSSVISKGCVPDSKYLTLYIIALRITLVCVTLLAALLIPHFALLMSFIGNFTGTFLVFVFPSVFYLKLRKGDLRLWEIIINVLIIIFGLLGGTVGIFSSGKALIKAYISKS